MLCMLHLSLSNDDRLFVARHWVNTSKMQSPVACDATKPALRPCMDKLLALNTLLEVADAGGFSKAAQRLGVATSSVTRLMDALETSLGTALLTRTPRKVSLTDAGIAYADQAGKVL